MTFKYRKLLSLCAVSALAIAVPQMASAAEAQTIDIAAQPLSSAIVQLSEQSDVTILVSDDLVRGLTARAVKGRMEPEKALRELLRGTGLRVSKGAGGALVISGNASSGGGGERPTPQALAGAVIDENTGAALKGVLVELVGTGKRTSTDDLGRYRFLGIDGPHRVRFSYLGFPATEYDLNFSNGRPATTVALINQPTNDEIVVIAGQVSARAQALNQERRNDNSTTIISSDLLGQFNGTTISDALRRSPGIAFDRDEETGDGTNVIVRGLTANYNQVTINGQQLPVGSGVDRTPNLSNILAGTISKVTINKTLLPSQDSSGTGGLIEIETASPLDRPRRYASFSAERLWRGKNFGDEYLISGTLSARFGSSGNLGVSLGYQRRRQDVFNISYSSEAGAPISPEYLPLYPNGTPIASPSYIDPRTPFPFETTAGAADYYPSLTIEAHKIRSTTETYTAAVEWEPFAGTNWQADYLFSSRARELTALSYAVGVFANYELHPIPALNGQLRYARNNFFVRRSLGFNGDETDSNTHTLSLRGKTEAGRWTFEYGGGYSRATERTPVRYSGNFNGADRPGGIPFDASLALPEAYNPDTGLLSSFYARQIGKAGPRLLLTQAGIDQIASPEGLGLSNLASGGEDGGSNISSANFSARYEPASPWVAYILTGGSFRRTQSKYQQDINSFYFPLAGVGPAPDRFGLDFRPIGFGRILGNASAIAFPSFESFSTLLTTAPSLVDDVTFGSFSDENPPPPLRTREDEIAAYVEAKLNFGDISVVGGLRYTHVKVSSDFRRASIFCDEDFICDPEFERANTVFITERAKQTTWLPRVIVNYRPNENFVARAGYYSTTARPLLSLVTQTSSLSLVLFPCCGPNFDQPVLSISKGNPALKPTSSHNFDVSIERYFGSVGAIKIAAYLKLLKNIVESSYSSGIASLDGIALPDDPRFQNLPPNIFIEGTQPVNNTDTAKAWGVEASVERQLDFLPVKGFGIYANYTYSGSSKTQRLNWSQAPVFDADGNVSGFESRELFVKGVSFDGQPKHSGTLGLTYSQNGLDASLYYTVQARRRLSYQNFKLHTYQEPTSTLDLRVQYLTGIFGPKLRFYAMGNNLLKSRLDADSRSSAGGKGGTPRYYTGAKYLGGRTITAGVSVDF